jgi:hypothetical protein
VTFALRPWLRLAPLLAACALAACGDKEKAGASSEKRPPPELRFDGYLYVSPRTSDIKIIERVREETRSAFATLRKARVMLTRRVVDNPDPGMFKREVVTVVDTVTGARDVAIRVRYRFVARPEVVHDVVDRKELPIALLQPDDDELDAQRVIRDCTRNTEADKGFASAVSLVFDASLDRCKAAIQAEQAAIDAARAKLSAAEQGDDTIVPLEEAKRLYLPATATITRLNRRRGEVSPRYASLDDEPTAQGAPEDVDHEPEKPIEPVKVIVDPDMAPYRRTPDELRIAALGGDPNPNPTPVPEAALLERGIEKGAGESIARVPAMLAPPVAAPPVAAPAPRPPEQPLGERLEFTLQMLADPKFLVVWLSLLMAYPILRRDPKQKSQKPDA